MKIKMITMAAGPNGIWAAGREVDVPNLMAMQLIDGGYAVAVKQIIPVSADKEVQTEAIAPVKPAVGKKKPSSKKKKQEPG